jgi:arginase family enzyme
VGAGKLRYKQAILAQSDACGSGVEKSLGEGRMPLVLGGDHSLAIGRSRAPAIISRARASRSA